MSSGAPSTTNSSSAKLMEIKGNIVDSYRNLSDALRKAADVAAQLSQLLIGDEESTLSTQLSNLGEMFGAYASKNTEAFQIYEDGMDKYIEKIKAIENEERQQLDTNSQTFQGIAQGISSIEF